MDLTLLQVVSAGASCKSHICFDEREFVLCQNDVERNLKQIEGLETTIVKLKEKTENQKQENDNLRHSLNLELELKRRGTAFAQELSKSLDDKEKALNKERRKVINVLLSLLSSNRSRVGSIGRR